MALAVPKLDDREFQDIVNEAKERIPQHCEQWTDHNVSDPGITLIELFAWMTDIILYRLNRVPDLHYIKMLELFGITLRGPVPAKAPVTFWLSASQNNPVLIPAGTEVASTQTETDRSIVFTTDVDFRVLPPQLSAVVSRVATSDGTKKTLREQNLRRLEAGFEGSEVFSAVPQVDDALYFGFENDLSHHILGFEADFDPAGGTGINPNMPPYVWEASTGENNSRWQECDVEFDTTKGMNQAGRVQIHLPKMSQYKLSNREKYWVRARVKKISTEEHEEGMRPYRLSPKLRKAAITSWGGTIPATHSRQVNGEFLGRTDGSPGARFQLKFTPILDRQPGETLVVQQEGKQPQDWEEVSDFASSRAEDPCFTLDSVTGELRLGPVVRQPDGTMKRYGAVPDKNANLIFKRYRFGGGQEGNVQAHILDTLKTAIPYIARVTNREPAWGGLDAETLEAAMARAPAFIRARDRAVTEADFEYLARQALPAAIGRVKCLQPKPAEASRVVPGQVYVLVIPHLANPAGLLTPEQLSLDEGSVATLREYLDERRLLTTRLEILPPAYHWVSVRAGLRAAPGFEEKQVRGEVLARLHRFLNPLTGGPDGEGWPFGRWLYISDVYQCLQGIPNIQFIRNVEMFNARPGGEAQGDEPIESIDVHAHGVVASGIHTVEFI